MIPTPLTAEKRAEIEARYLPQSLRPAGIGRSGMYLEAAWDVPRLLAAEQYERDRADAAEKRAGRLAMLLEIMLDDQIHGEAWAETINAARAALAEEPKPQEPQEPPA